MVSSRRRTPRTSSSVPPRQGIGGSRGKSSMNIPRDQGVGKETSSIAITRRGPRGPSPGSAPPPLPAEERRGPGESGTRTKPDRRCPLPGSGPARRTRRARSGSTARRRVPYRSTLENTCPPRASWEGGFRPPGLDAQVAWWGISRERSAMVRPVLFEGLPHVPRGSAGRRG